MTDEFCKVTRKKWISRNGIQKNIQRNSERNYEDFPEVDVDSFLKRLVKIKESMLSTDYFIDVVKILEDNLKEPILNSTIKLENIICFGIGPFTRTYHALHQLAFILCLQSHFGIEEAVYYDPVFRESEKKILESLKCKVMKENCEAKYEVNVPSLFYLPHCPSCLTNNLLWSNWSHECLQNVFIINNSFEVLVQSRPEDFLKKDSAYILEAIKYVREVPLEDDYEMRNVFNDLSLHLFPKDIIPPHDDSFWNKGEAPDYENYDDEMISALKID